jgi:hypothetical protein
MQESIKVVKPPCDVLFLATISTKPTSPLRLGLEFLNTGRINFFTIAWLLFLVLLAVSVSRRSRDIL